MTLWFSGQNRTSLHLHTMAVCHGLSQLQYFADEILQLLKVTGCGSVSVCRVNSVIGIGVGAGAYILTRFAVSSLTFFNFNFIVSNH